MPRNNLQLVKRNASEIVTEEEIKKLLSLKKPKTYTGYEPSGTIHLGHLVTVNKLIDLSEAGFEVTVLLADVHAHLNEKGDLEKVKEIAKMNKKAFEAYGLDANYVLGSDFQLKKDYVLDLHRLAVNTTMKRAQRSMDEVSRSKKHIHVSQILYPLMQALDIAYMDINLAVGGTDQRKIHMLARERLPKIGYESPSSLHTPILTGLDGEKMSSSKENWIDLSDTSKDVEEKLEKAYCPEGDVKNNPVLEIAKHFIFPFFESMEVNRPKKYGGKLSYQKYKELEKDFKEKELHPLDLKKSTSKYLDKVIEPAREKLKEGYT